MVIEGDRIEANSTQVGLPSAVANQHGVPGKRKQRCDRLVASLRDRLRISRSRDQPVSFFQPAKEVMAVGPFAGQLLCHTKDAILRLDRVGPIG